MTDFRDRYKRVGYDRGDVDINRALRSQRRDEDRRDARTEHFGLRRNLAAADQDDTLEQDEIQRHQDEEDSNKNTETEVLIQKRLLQLEKWREERNRKKLLEKKKAKPVFKVGVVHHRVYSPLTNKEPVPLPPPKLCKTKELSETETVPKRVTRATEKRLALKAVTNQQKKENLRRKKEKKPEAGVYVKNDAPSLPFAPSDHQFKAPKGVTALPMFGITGTVATSNFKFTNSPKEISIIDSPKVSVCDKSDMIFPPGIDNHSFILAKSSTKLSSLRNSLLQKKVVSKQDSINNPEQDSMNNSSIESVVLKMSTDDQETLDDQENIHSSHSRFSDATKYFIRRRSSRVLTPTEFNVNNEAMETAYENEELEKDEKVLNNLSSRKSKRFSIAPDTINEKVKTVDDESVTNAMEISDSDDDVKEESLKRDEPTRKIVKKNEKFSNSTTSQSEEFVNQNGENTSLDTLEKTNVKSGKRKSTKDSKLKNVQSESSVLNRKESDSLEVRRSTRNLRSTKIVEKLSNVCISESDEVINSENQLPSSNKRKSKILDKSSESKEPEKEINVKFTKPKAFRKKHLLDSSLSDNRISSRFTEVLPNFPDQSLIKFSPRRSVRTQPETTQNPPSADSQLPSPGNRITYSLVKLSPLKMPIQTSSQAVKELPNLSKSVKDGFPAVDDDTRQNFSLNVSLPKITSPNRPLAYFSPYVVSSRGKSSSRKEAQKRRFSQPITNPEELPTKETIMQKLNISIEEEERTAQYYKHVLNQEIERLNELCENWDKIKESDQIPEDIHYQIQAAIGHTNLLIRKKFERFRGLVLDCETGKGEMLVTCKDLQGFWDMMYREIKDCDNRFNKLESLKANNWVDNEPEVKEQEEKKKKIIKKPVAKKKPVASKPSSLRAHIMAARKKKLEEKEGDDIEMKEAFNPISEEKEVPKKVVSPKINRRTSTPKSHLRKATTKSGDSKSNPSPLIAMKISKKLKTPEVLLDESIIYINSDRTPAKGILKSAKDETLIGVKSANKVFFKEQPMEVQEFDSTKGITEISDGELDEPKEPIERRLNFDNESFNGSNAESERENEIKIEFNKEKQTSTTPSLYVEPNHAVRPPSPILSLSPFNVISKSSPVNIPKIQIVAASPLISMSPLSIDDTKKKTQSSKKTATSVIPKSKQIKFKDDSSEKTLPLVKSSKFPFLLTPKPKTRNSMICEDSHMEVEEDVQASKTSKSLEEDQPQNKVEFYLNKDGIICQRTVEMNKNTPKLKRRNSERAGRLKINSKDSGHEPTISSRLRTKRSHMADEELKTPESLADNFAQRSANSSTPRVRRQQSKNSDVDKTPIYDNLISNTEDSTPKTSKKTPKALKNTRNLDLNGSIQAHNELPRSKSLNIRKMVLENELSKEQTSSLTPSSSKRKNSRITRLSMKN